MYVHQSIQRPYGVNVFGSSVIRVKPDHALLAFAVTRTASKPAEAFAATRSAVEAVGKVLAEGAIASADIALARPTLRQQFRTITGGETTLIGYTARADFSVVLRELDRLEQVQAAIVDAGADVLEATALRSTRLPELRAQARERALQAAARKAEAMARTARIVLARIVHIEDINPDELRSRRGHGADLDLAVDEASTGPLDPGSIDVCAAVMVGYAIERDAVPPSGF